MSPAPQFDPKDLDRIAAELAPTGLVLVNPAGTIVYTNPELDRLFGYERGRLIGESIDVLVPERLRAGHHLDRARFFADPARRPMGHGRDLFGLRRDGGEFPVEIGLNPVSRPDGVYVMASVVDITARKRAEQRFHVALEAAPAGMLVVDQRGRILLVNREIERILGWPRAELIGQSVELLVPDRLGGTHPGLRQDYLRQATARQMGAGRELYARRRDGAEIPVEIGLNPVETDEGTLVIASLVDLRARRVAERALRESEERFRLLVDGIEDYAIYMLDPQGNVASWSRGAERIKGYREAEILGRPNAHFFVEEDIARGRPAEILRAAAREGRYEEDGYRVRKDGSRYLAHVVIFCLRDGEGGVRGFAKVEQDVTLKRQLEDQLRHAQKMEAVGTLAGGIAHDFNNILSAVLGFAELIRPVVHPVPRANEDLEHLLTAVERGRQLVRRILTFSRKQDNTRTVVRLDEEIGEAVKLLRATLPSTIEIVTRFDERTPPVRSDPTLLHQIILNLGTNSSHAMPRGGRLSVALDPVWADASLSLRHPSLQRGLHARIEVSDNGIGMPPEVLERAFEPFFTTKPAGEGTGMGLSVVRDIVLAHEGALDIQSEPGRGTRVYIYLPAAVTDHPTFAAPEVTAQGGRGERILLVDDEELVAQALSRLLEGLNYQVSVHRSSLEALQALRDDPSRFDLLVSDVTMPQLTGTELSQLAHGLRPELPILLMSGYTDAVDAGALRAYGVREVLLKPVSANTLERAIQRAIGAAEPERAGS